MHLAVIRAGIEHALLRRRLVERVDHAAVFDTDVVRRQAAGDLLPVLVVRRKVRTDYLPALAPVRRAVHVLAGHEERIRVVRREQQRERPLEAVLQRLGRPSAGALRPDFHVADVPIAHVHPGDNAAARAGAGRARPDHVRVARIGRREAALTAADRKPVAARDAVAIQGIARSARRRAVLTVPHHIVWNRVIDRNVVHLRDGQVNAVPGLAAVIRYADPLVVATDHPVGVRGVDPEVVVVATRAAQAALCLARAPAVDRLHEGRGEEVRLIGIVGGDATLVVVAGAPAEVAVVAHELPGPAAVVRAPELTAFCRLSLPGNTVPGLDQGIDAPRVGGRHADIDLSHGKARQAVALELRPGVAAVARQVDAAVRAAALASPRVIHDVPHAGEQDARVVGVHDQRRGSRVLVDEQHVLPRLPAVPRAVDAPLALRSVGMA